MRYEDFIWRCILRIIFAITFSARLFVHPVSFSVQRMVELGRFPEFIYGLVISFIITCSGLMKFLQIDFEFVHIATVFSIIMMLHGSVYGYGQIELDGMTMFSYTVQA